MGSYIRNIRCDCGHLLHLATQFESDENVIYFCDGCALAWSPLKEFSNLYKRQVIRLPDGKLVDASEFECSYTHYELAKLKDVRCKNYVRKARPKKLRNNL